MNYRHIYHAGNFADVVKHSILSLLVNYLRQKESPFCYIDTHAGEGLYDLNSSESIKTKEAMEGIQRIIDYSGTHPICIHNYLESVKSFQWSSTLNQYPGSPLLVSRWLRERDQMILNELHPEINRLLKQNLLKQKNVTIHQRNAYEFLPSILPPKYPRGLILLDPPFENKTENKDMECVLRKSLLRWQQGIYLIWYPLTVKVKHNFKEFLIENGLKKYLIAEFTIANQLEITKGLIGCGFLIINPIWKLAESLSQLLNHLGKIFNKNGQAQWRITESGD